MKRHAPWICAPPDPDIFHFTGEIACGLSPLVMARMTLDNAFLRPGDTWRCDCHRWWIYTLYGWRRRYPMYIGKACGKRWTNSRIAELLAGREDVMTDDPEC